jgi:putative nucleotidyltransferase with HDIG domain
MFGIGQKRSRVSRTVAFRPQASVWSRLTAAVQDRTVLLRLAICLLAIIGMSVAVQSWKAPFPYREGDSPAHGLSAKINFTRPDTERTEQARRAAEDQAPFVFRNRPDLLDPLPQQLRAALGNIAQAESPEELPEETSAAFGLQRDPNVELEGVTQFQSQYPDDRFRKLKEAVSGGDEASAQQRIDDVIDDFTKFITPLRTLGVIDPRDVREKKIRDESRIRVLTPDQIEEVENVFLPQVQLGTRLSDAGDLGKAWLSYPGIPAAIRPAISYWLLHETPYTLRYDDVSTRQAKSAAREKVKPIIEMYSEGDQLVAPGEVILATHLNLLRAEYEAAESQIAFSSRMLRVGVVFAMLVVLAVLQGYYVVYYEPRLARSLGRLTVYMVVIVLAAAAGRWLSYWSRAEIIPLVATVMVFAIAFNQVLATLTGFTLALVLTLSTTTGLDQFVVLMSTAATVAIPLNRVASRSALIKVGFYAGVTYFLTTVGIDIVETQTLGEVFGNKALLARAAWGAAYCLATGYIVAGSLPFIESTFGVVTDISLLELSDPSHPLLQELVRRAPGTYNHSIAVASVAEAAAESIGANGLLVRVGAYFHDIGKMLKPQYFIENVQAGAESRHSQLAPAMSTLIIIGHVKDGVDLAEQHNLPRALIDFIEQHHGTTLVEYFYHAATKQAEADPDHGQDAEESAFRYPGPKPQTPEAGVLMLADAVESASRTLSDPTPKRIESLVHSLTMKRLLDGQFEECSLRLTDIRTIEKSLVKSLIGTYHGRIRYPEAKPTEVRSA